MSTLVSVSTRRGILKWLTGVPFLGAAAVSGGAPLTNDSHPCGIPALAKTRWLNTLQLRHKLTFGRYATADELMADWITWAAESEDGATKERVTKNPPELTVPGWTLRLNLSTYADAYLLSVSTDEPAEPFVLASDETGVIYYGALPADQAPPVSYARVSDTYPSLTALQAPQVSTRERLLDSARRLAYGGFGATLQSSSCACRGTCYSTGQIGCCNLGFGSCPWCCFGSCSGCYYLCYAYCSAPCACG